jgi:putative 2-oxoglutarate-Fe(II)-dependent oxygenase superfamily protein
MKVIPFYSVPIIEFRMQDHEGLCAQLREIFLAKAAGATQFRNRIDRDTQKGSVFESRFDLYCWPEEPVQRMRDFVHHSLCTALREICDHSEEEFAQLSFHYHSWFHVTRMRGHQGIHNHANASWSGIYCIDPGDKVPERPDSGKVYFHDPRANANYFEDAVNSRLKLPFKHGAIPVKHEAGKLTLFPSYLLHEIFPFYGAKERIIAPFNCWVTTRGSDTDLCPPGVWQAPASPI